MQFHNLKRNHPYKKSPQVGRGGKRGKTSGRGGKGQTARAGHKVRPEYRDVLKKLPKLRGRGKHGLKGFGAAVKPVNLKILDKSFVSGETVTAASLLEKGLVKTRSGNMPAIKILGDGELTKKLNISGLAISKSARGAVLKAGGQVS